EGLDCFRYDYGRPDLSWASLCFTGRGLLVESLTATSRGASVSSVLPVESRAPVDIGPAALARAAKVADRIVGLTRIVDELTVAHSSCDQAVRSAIHRRGPGK